MIRIGAMTHILLLHGTIHGMAGALVGAFPYDGALLGAVHTTERLSMIPFVVGAITIHSGAIVDTMVTVVDMGGTDGAGTTMPIAMDSTMDCTTVEALSVRDAVAADV